MDYNMTMRRPVPGYSRWEADEEGNVYRDGVVRPGWIAQKYIWVWACGKSIKRSWLVAFAFHGPRPDGLELCHINDIPDDDAPSNIKWGTHTENIRDSVKNGTHYTPSGWNKGLYIGTNPKTSGENHYRAKLSDIDVIALRDDAASGDFTRKQLSEMYGIHVMAVGRIIRRESRTNV